MCTVTGSGLCSMRPPPRASTCVIAHTILLGMKGPEGLQSGSSVGFRGVQNVLHAATAQSAYLHIQHVIGLMPSSCDAVRFPSLPGRDNGLGWLVKMRVVKR